MWMETDVNMESVGAVLDVFQKVGLEVIIKLGPVLITLFMMLWGVRYIIRQVNAVKDGIVSTPSKVVKGAAQAGQNLTVKAASAAGVAAGHVGALAVDHALPAAQQAAAVAIDGAKVGASHVVALAARAAPHAHDAVEAAASAAKVGAGVVRDGAVKAAPVIQSAAGAAYDVGKKGIKALGIMAQVKADEMLERAQASRCKAGKSQQTEPSQGSDDVGQLPERSLGRH